MFSVEVITLFGVLYYVIELSLRCILWDFYPCPAARSLSEDQFPIALADCKEAVAGKKRFLFTHSSIFPGTYASTMECADYLIKELRLSIIPKLKQGPLGMQQLGST